MINTDVKLMNDLNAGKNLGTFKITATTPIP